MARYKLVGASHVEGKRTFQRGDVIESTKNLAAAFPLKFQLVVDPPPAVSVDPPAMPPLATQAELDAITAQAGAGVAGPPEGVVPSTLGADVTEAFKDAAAKGLLVLKQGAKHNVARASAPNAALNDELLTKMEAKAFIADYDG